MGLFMDMEAGSGGVISGPGMKNMIMVNLKNIMMNHKELFLFAIKEGIVNK